MAELPAAKDSIATVERESSPPASTVASPAPQYWSDDNSQTEVIQGENGGMYVLASGLHSGTWRPMAVNASGGLSVNVNDGVETLLINTDGSIDVRDDETIVEDTQTSAASLAIGGGADTFVLTPTAGTIAELISWSIWCNANGAWASGHHDVGVRYASSALNYAFLMNWQYDDNLFIVGGLPDANGYFDPGLAGTGPRDPSALMTATKGLKFSSTSPLTIEYLNFASAATTETRTFHAQYIERKVS